MGWSFRSRVRPVLSKKICLWNEHDIYQLTKKTNREIIKKTDTPATAWVERAVTGGSGHGERMELIKNKREAIRK